MLPDSDLAVRITVRRPLRGVTLALQRGRAELLEPSLSTSDAVVFDFRVRVGPMQSGAAPRLLGPFTQGPPAARFVYVNAGSSAGQLASRWNRRAKVPLAGITMAMIQAATQTPGGRVETEFEGTGRDGGPTCATVKPIVWRVSTPDRERIRAPPSPSRLRYVVLSHRFWLWGQPSPRVMESPALRDSVDRSLTAGVPADMHLTLIAAAALGCLGCASTTGLSSDVPASRFTTDATAYVAQTSGSVEVARYSFDVISRFENRGAVTLYLGRCRPDSPQPLFGVDLAEPAGSGSRSGYAYFWACVGHDRQFAVKPGEVRVDTLHVAGPNAFDGVTKEPLGVTEGTFRLRFDVRSAPGDGLPDAPPGVGYSNTFVVRRSAE